MRRRHRSPFFFIILGFLLLVILCAAVLALPIAFGSKPGLSGLLAVVDSVTGKPVKLEPQSEPESQQTARSFFRLWNEGKYDDMYGMLSEASRNQFPQDRFVTRYSSVGSVIAISGVNVDIKAPPKASTPVAGAEKTTKYQYSISFNSAILGKFGEDNELTMVQEGDQWRVEWTPSLIFQGLTDDNRVNLDTENALRGDIVDRNGRPLATSGKVLSVGVVPRLIKNEGKALSTLSEYLGLKPEVIKTQYAKSPPDWWIPIKDLPFDKKSEATAKFSGISGIELRENAARSYPNGSYAAHVIGYISEINATQLKTLGPRGYQVGDTIGQAGIEASMEENLVGKKNAVLNIVGKDGQTIRTVAESTAGQGKTVQLSIDIDLQRKAEDALGSKVGSVVVIDPRDNSVLALVSHPAYDPNSFVLGISGSEWKRLTEDKTLPFLNRAIMSAYPTGSIFKVVTMAAGMESAGITAETQFDSPPQWKLPGTSQLFSDSLPQGHGQLNTMDGLAQSSNDVFYEIAYKLNTLSPSLLPDMAKELGVGQPTGINGLAESAGTLPNSDWKQRVKNVPWNVSDAINLSIGQSYLEATPLQMANLYTALANGGTLRTPLLVKRIGTGTEAKDLASEQKAKISVSKTTLDAIREGMKRAVSDPRGTAYNAFKGFSVPTAAKTGSAENQTENAHAWLASFAPAENPEVVVLVMVESGGAGGEVAAPIARSVLEGYFGR